MNSSVDSGAASSGPPEVSAPPADALVFVPGLGKSEAVRGSHVAELVCWELNQRAEAKDVTFAITPMSVGTEVVQRVERVNGDGSSISVLDVYTYDSVAELDRNTTRGNPFVRALSLAVTAVVAVIAVIGVMINLRRHGKSRRQLLQAVVVLLMVVCILVYFGIAVYALAEAVAVIVRGNSAGAEEEPLIRWPQWVVLIGAVAGGLFPSVREQVNWLGERCVQMARYVWTGGLRSRLSGGLQDLIDRVWSRSEIEAVHVVGYSFGSLVALETIYPHNSHPAAALRSVASLTTIGSPFDLVRMVKPEYARERTVTDEIRPRWINVYQPIDVLGSNFREFDDDVVKPTKANHFVGVSGPGGQRHPDVNLAWNPDLRLTLLNSLMLRSVSVHAGYWDEATTANSALGPVVQSLFGSSWVLRGEARQPQPVTGEAAL